MKQSHFNIHRLQKHTNLVSRIAIAFSILFYAYIWFSNIDQLELFSDEIAWVYDARFFHYRLQRDWSKFTLLDKFPANGWQDPKFRLTDQPQMGKYIFGFFLTLAGQTEIFSAPITRFGSSFPKTPASPTALIQSQDFLGDTFYHSISFIRHISTVVGFLTLLLFFYLVTQATSSRLTGLIAFLLASFNPVISHYFRLALTDTYLIFFSLLAFTVFWQLIPKLSQPLSRRTIILSITFGFFSALATSTKLNGAFLIFLPLTAPALLAFKTRLHHQKPEPQVDTVLASVAAIFLTLILAFVFLEPELWLHPIKGISVLLTSRTLQHQAFYHSYGQVSLLHAPSYFVLHYLSNLNSPVFLFFKIVFLAIGTLILLQRARRKQSYFILTYFLLFILLSNSYYGRVVGNDRYLIPSFLAFSVIISIGISGLADCIINKRVPFHK